MSVITLQRLVDSAFGGSYKALHDWEAEIAGRYGMDFWSAYRAWMASGRLEFHIDRAMIPPVGLSGIIQLATLEANQVIQPGGIRRIVAFLALESERSHQSEAVVAFLRKEVVDQ